MAAGSSPSATEAANIQVCLMTVSGAMEWVSINPRETGYALTAKAQHANFGIEPGRELRLTTEDAKSVELCSTLQELGVKNGAKVYVTEEESLTHRVNLLQTATWIAYDRLKSAEAANRELVDMIKLLASRTEMTEAFIEVAKGLNERTAKTTAEFKDSLTKQYEEVQQLLAVEQVKVNDLRIMNDQLRGRVEALEWQNRGMDDDSHGTEWKHSKHSPSRHAKDRRVYHH